MNYQVSREFENQAIKIPVRSKQKVRLVVRVKHHRKPYTYYFDSAPVINGTDEIIVKIPKMPPFVIMEIYNEANGNVAEDTTFQVGKITCNPIRVDFSTGSITNPTVRSFAKFSDEFAENAGILSAQNSIYVSPDGRYKIHYKDVIRDESGKELKTPARINTHTGVIEISKKYYIQHTVPGRKWTNWHEFSHLWRNVEKASELEADKNAIVIYLATGNPTVEAYNGIYRIFKNTPSDLNRLRYDQLNAFIRKYNDVMYKQIK